MTEMPIGTTKSRVEARLKVMIREGGELDRAAQAASDRAAQVRLDYAVGRATREELQAAQAAHRDAVAARADHADSAVLLADAHAELEAQEHERQQVARVTATRARLDALEVGTARHLEAAEREAISASHAYRKAAEEAEGLRAQLRGEVLALARMRGQLAGHENLPALRRLEVEEVMLRPHRALAEQALLSLRPILGVSRNPANDTDDHARRWGRTLDDLAALGDKAE